MAYPVRPITRPAVLKGHTNGKLPASILVDTPGQQGGPTVRLVLPAARAWRALCAAALHAGIVLKAVGPHDSYRPYETQERIFLQRYTRTYLAGRPSKAWNGERWYQKPGTAIAAVPGTSNHGDGITVDTGEENDGDAAAESLGREALAWLLANEERFGWSHELQPEPWHIRYWAGDQIPQAVLDYEAGLSEHDRPAPAEEDDMPLYEVFEVIDAPDQPPWLVGDGGRTVIPNSTYHQDAAGDLGVKRVKRTTWDLICAHQDVTKAEKGELTDDQVRDLAERISADLEDDIAETLLERLRDRLAS